MTNEKIAEQSIALEHAALVEWCKGNPSAYLELYAPELTYFDPWTQHRLDLAEVTAMYEGLRGKMSGVRFELVNPVVQIHDGVAVLSFNYRSTGFEGMWNCTEVYRRVAGAADGGGPDDIGVWKIIHNHWSDVHKQQ